MTPTDFFKIEVIDGQATKFTNYSNFNCFLAVKQKPPKRGYRDRRLIHPGSFIIFDHLIDMTMISIRFDNDID